MAILVVALATTVAVAISANEHLELRRSENMLGAGQGYLYALGGETWAGLVLTRDRKDNNTDNLTEDWARKGAVFPVERGQISGYIEDMQGRYNLNNLVSSGKPNDVEINRFRHLLEVLQLDPSLADAVVDWIDPDSQPRFPDGAEDDYYQGLDPPYRAANQPMASTSELLLVKGFTRKIYDTLKPYVAALPTTTPVNINTASLPVLEAMFPNVPAGDIQQLVDKRQSTPYTTVKSFLADPVFAGLKVSANGLTVASYYFQIHILAQVGRSDTRLDTLVLREDNGTIHVLARALGGL